MAEEIYDVIIVGGGPAGLTAALYSSRRTLKTLLLTKDLGGQAAISYDIENYPAIELTSGLALMQKFAHQAQKFGTEIKYGQVIKIKKQKNNFFVQTEREKFTTKAIILAFGLEPKDLNIPGEKKFKGRGVSLCATCDAPLYKDKTVAVIGGGNSALDAAELLTKIAKKVYLIHRRNQFRGEEIIIERLKKNPQVEMVLSSEIVEIKGEQIVKAIVVKNNGGGKTREIDIDGVFVEIGIIPNSDLVKDIASLNFRGEIVTDPKTQGSSRVGIWAAGDATDGLYRQNNISAGDAVKAVLNIYDYLKN